MYLRQKQHNFLLYKHSAELFRVGIFQDCYIEKQEISLIKVTYGSDHISLLRDSKTSSAQSAVFYLLDSNLKEKYHVRRKIKQHFFSLYAICIVVLISESVGSVQQKIKMPLLKQITFCQLIIFKIKCWNFQAAVRQIFDFKMLASRMYLTQSLFFIAD